MWHHVPLSQTWKSTFHTDCSGHRYECILHGQRLHQPTTQHVFLLALWCNSTWEMFDAGDFRSFRHAYTVQFVLCLQTQVSPLMFPCLLGFFLFYQRECFNHVQVNTFWLGRGLTRVPSTLPGWQLDRKMAAHVVSETLDSVGTGLKRTVTISDCPIIGAFLVMALTGTFILLMPWIHSRKSRWEGSMFVF